MTSRPAPRKPSAAPTERFTPPPRTPFDPGDGLFPVFPPRGDMQNPIYLHRPGHLAALSRHFGSPETTIVLGEVPVGRDLSQRRGLRVPDLLIAFSVDPDRIIADRGYSIKQWGKPPDFVLEIASENTAENDATVKRDDYAAFGIPEYWRFRAANIIRHPGTGWLAAYIGPSASSGRMTAIFGAAVKHWDWTSAGRMNNSAGIATCGPSMRGGEYYPAGLAGDRLVGGVSFWAIGI